MSRRIGSIGALHLSMRPNERSRRADDAPAPPARRPGWGRGQASSSSLWFRATHHASNPRPIATLARKVQNQANPLASATSVGSVMSLSEVNPMIATARHMAAKIAAITIVAWIENFRCASAYRTGR